jgi:hypothetical protein
MCANCKDKGEVVVHVRANEYRTIPCGVCKADKLTYKPKEEFKETAAEQGRRSLFPWNQ